MTEFGGDQVAECVISIKIGFDTDRFASFTNRCDDRRKIPMTIGQQGNVIATGDMQCWMKCSDQAIAKAHLAVEHELATECCMIGDF